MCDSLEATAILTFLQMNTFSVAYEIETHLDTLLFTGKLIQGSVAHVKRENWIK